MGLRRSHRLAKHLGKPAALECKRLDRSRLHGVGQHLLGIGARVEDEAHHPPVHPRHRRPRQTVGPRAGPVGPHLHHQAPLARSGQLVDRASRHQPPGVDDGRRLAHVLDQIELVAREQHRPARRCLLGEDRAHGIDTGRVEARQWLVQHQQLGLVQEGAGELDPLLVPQRQGFDLAGSPVSHPEHAQPPVGSHLRLRGKHAVEPAQVHELVAHGHPRVQAALLGHVSELPPILRTDQLSSPPDLATVQVHQPEHRPHGRRLARAVRPEEAHHLPGGDHHGQPVERHHVAESPGEVPKLELTLLAMGSAVQ